MLACRAIGKFCHLCSIDFLWHGHRVTQLGKKFKHLFEKMLHLSVVGCLIVLFEQLFENLPQGQDKGFLKKNLGEKQMGTFTVTTGFNSMTSKSIVNQSLQAIPSGRHAVIKLSRRGRLARTLVVLSLTVVMAAGFASQSGAGQVEASTAPSYEIVVVAPGETLWSVAAAYASGDVQGLVNEIREVNNLQGFDLQAGQRLRIPTA
ncbi:MAG: LysM peptidoglycan-binding domain-containing protein [Candidatus Planktophila sp.]|nr:LysM peptidoglycan-binding domain-containing protein [Candidatus Planktophila sp.]